MHCYGQTQNAEHTFLPIEIVADFAENERKHPSQRKNGYSVCERTGTSVFVSVCMCCSAFSGFALISTLLVFC